VGVLALLPQDGLDDRRAHVRGQRDVHAVRGRAARVRRKKLSSRMRIRRRAAVGSRSRDHVAYTRRRTFLRGRVRRGEAVQIHGRRDESRVGESPRLVVRRCRRRAATNEDHDWAVELNSPNALMRAGWKRDTLRVGDSITVEGVSRKTAPRPATQGPWLRPAGEKLVRGIEPDVTP
jgi:hypothetical protein